METKRYVSIWTRLLLMLLTCRQLRKMRWIKSSESIYRRKLFAMLRRLVFCCVNGRNNQSFTQGASRHLSVSFVKVMEMCCRRTIAGSDWYQRNNWWSIGQRPCFVRQSNRLSVQNIVGQGYVGGNNMRGASKGVQVKIKQLHYSLAVLHKIWTGHWWTQCSIVKLLMLETPLV